MSHHELFLRCLLHQDSALHTYNQIPPELKGFKRKSSNLAVGRADPTRAWDLPFDYRHRRLSEQAIIGKGDRHRRCGGDSVPTCSPARAISAQANIGDCWRGRLSAHAFFGLGDCWYRRLLTLSFALLAQSPGTAAPGPSCSVAGDWPALLRINPRRETEWGSFLPTPTHPAQPAHQYAPNRHSAGLVRSRPGRWPPVPPPGVQVLVRRGVIKCKLT